MALYGVIPTWQTEPTFGRVYAAYGGIFIVLSIVWGRFIDGWRPDRYDFCLSRICVPAGTRFIDGWRPDRYDLASAGIALAGVVLILWGRDWFGWVPGSTPTPPG